MLSCYYVVKDNVEEGAIDASFFPGYLLMIVVTIVMGAASVTGMPRVIGKKISKPSLGTLNQAHRTNTRYWQVPLQR